MAESGLMFDKLEAGAFKFLRNQLFMMSMQLPRKKTFRQAQSRKCRARYHDVAKTTCGIRQSNYLPLLLYRIPLSMQGSVQN
jgi:hypothetical protein